MEDVSQAFIAQSRQFLRDEYLPKLERCLERLSDEKIWWRAGEESNSIGNLLLHLTGNVRQWIISGIGGLPDTRVRQREFDEREGPGREQLLKNLRATLSEVDETLARVESAQLLERRMIQGNDVSTLEAIYHVVEHFSTHTGQIILLTKMLAREDLGFYDFTAGAPEPRWHKEQIEEPDV